MMILNMDKCLNVQKTCKGATPVVCPNYECATDYYASIAPPNDCPIGKPFKCPVN